MEQILLNQQKAFSFGKTLKKVNKVDLFTIIAVVIAIIWQAFSRYLVHIDGAGRIPLFMITTAFLLNMKSYRVFPVWTRRAIGFWFFWTLFHLFNLYIQGSDYVIWNSPSDVYWNLTGKFFFLCACTIYLNRHFYSGIISILFAFLFNISLYYLDSNWEFEISTECFRYFSSVINANEVALECVVCTILTSILLMKNKNWAVFLVLIDAFTINLIIITASRTAFLAVLPSIFSFAYLLFYHFKRNVAFLFIAIALLLCFSPRMIHAFSNSALSQRFETREGIVQNALENEKLAKVFGERAFYIENGYKLFLDNPVFGIGYTNFAEYFNYRNHIEYMAELSDGGLVGFFLFISFFFCMIFPVYKMRKMVFYKIEILVLVCMIMSILIFNGGLFTTSLFPFYCISALIFSMTGSVIANSPDLAFLFQHHNTSASSVHSPEKHASESVFS